MRTVVVPCDYHQHLERGPLTRECVLRFVDRGACRGVQEFGFSEHCDRFWEAAHLRCNHWRERDLVSIADYFDLLSNLQAEGYPTRIGVEVDYLPHLAGESGRFGLLAQAAGSGLFDSLAHPDVIKLFGHRPSRPMLDIGTPSPPWGSCAAGVTA